MSFTTKSIRNIPEINTTGTLFIHDGTGAKLLSLVNKDENKCFGISFRTPAFDSSGVSHIMEHSVLCGSRKYPVKEPFVEIIKGSLQTFVNAFTFPDKTCYPCASQNLKDFYNLIDIYMDAVFFPLIPEHTLRQEGWHYEVNPADESLSFKGVVFNEMKGAYSSPDDLLGDRSRSSLFPDNTYKFDSGGDPLAIPDLTYETFKSFHENYYHPSNSYIYFYGDDPEAERLNIVESWLSQFDRKNVDSHIAMQPKFEKPFRSMIPYDSGDSASPKSHLSINWLLSDYSETQTNLELSLLSHVLLATPASPLKRALIESGYGEDVIGGFEEQLQQTMFSAGLKGIEKENIEKVENLIIKTLADVVKNGFDPLTIAASLNTMEFHLREQNTGRFPRGLSMMLGVLNTWLYDGDPMDALAFEKPLALLKEKAVITGYLERVVEKYLINNFHRSTVVLYPDPEEGKRRNNIEKDRLNKIKAELTNAELQDLINLAEELKIRQDTPDSPEALATIPSLSIEDIDRNISQIPCQLIQLSEVPVYFHDLFTNGILYLDIGFDLHSVPQELIPFAGLLGRLLLEMGTEKEDFVQLTQRIGTNTGGIHSAGFNSSRKNSKQSAAWFFIKSKAIISQSGELLNLLKDIFLSARFDQKERFKQIILERKAGLEAGLVPGGSSIVNLRLRSHLNEADQINEQMQGITHLFFLRTLLEEIESNWTGVLQKLESLRKHLLNQKTMVVNVTLDSTNFSAIENNLSTFLSSIPKNNLTTPAWSFKYSKNHEGLGVPSQVNFVGKGANLYELGYDLHGSVQVINNFLQTTWLWEKIRVQGGA
ncbi:MAG: insulinase family protein, partial [Chloroflexota bacterium]